MTPFVFCLLGSPLGVGPAAQNTWGARRSDPNEAIRVLAELRADVNVTANARGPRWCFGAAQAAVAVFTPGHPPPKGSPRPVEHFALFFCEALGKRIMFPQRGLLIHTIPHPFGAIGRRRCDRISKTAPKDGKSALDWAKELNQPEAWFTSLGTGTALDKCV